MDYGQLLHAHKGIIYLFLAFFLFKLIFMFANKEAFLNFKNKKGAKIAEAVLGTLVLVSGVMLLMATPHSSGWIHAKITMAIVAIPLAIVGFKKDNKVLIILSFIIFCAVYVIGQQAAKGLL